MIVIGKLKGQRPKSLLVNYIDSPLSKQIHHRSNKIVPDFFDPSKRQSERLRNLMAHLSNHTEKIKGINRAWSLDIYENRLMSLRQNQTETLGDAQFHEINKKFKIV